MVSVGEEVLGWVSCEVMIRMLSGAAIIEGLLG